MTNDDIVIRPLRASDAESLVDCFRRCYGGSYVAGTFLEPARVAASLEEGRLRSVVAVAPGGGVLGHMGLTPREGGALTAELGNTVVDPRHRGRDLAVRLTLELTRQCLALGLVGFIHYPTTAHPAMQKLAAKGGGIELGVLLDYIPAQTRYVGFETSGDGGRTAVVAFYHELAAAPARHVWVPARHHALARSIYERAGLERDLAASESPLPSRGAELVARFEERRGMLWIEVKALGADLSAQVAGELKKHPEAPAMLDLPLDEPAAGAATEALAEAGFFFGAILPEYRAGGDALRLQRLAAEPVEPRLETSRAKQLFLYSVEDRSQVGSRD